MGDNPAETNKRVNDSEINGRRKSARMQDSDKTENLCDYACIIYKEDGKACCVPDYMLDDRVEPGKQTMAMWRNAGGKYTKYEAIIIQYGGQPEMKKLCNSATVASYCEKIANNEEIHVHVATEEEEETPTERHMVQKELRISAKDIASRSSKSSQVSKKISNTMQDPKKTKTNVIKPLATVIDIAEAQQVSVNSKDSPEPFVNTGGYRITEQCLSSLLEIENNTFQHPLLLELLKSVKVIKEDIGRLFSEISSVKEMLQSENNSPVLACVTPKADNKTLRTSCMPHTPAQGSDALANCSPIPVTSSTPIQLPSSLEYLPPLRLDSSEDDISIDQAVNHNQDSPSLHTLKETGSLILQTENVLCNENLNPEESIHVEYTTKNVSNAQNTSSNHGGNSLPNVTVLQNISNIVPFRTETCSSRSVWDLTLAQLDAAKPWNTGSIASVVVAPDNNLSQIVLGQGQEISPTLLAWARSRATTKCGTHTDPLLLIKETCKQLFWRLFLLKETYNRNVKGSNNKLSVDPFRVRALLKTYHNMLVEKELEEQATENGLITYINTRLRKQIHMGITKYL